MVHQRMKTAALLGVMLLFGLEAQAIIRPIDPSTPRSLKAIDVEDDGGFENSYYIEGDYEDTQEPVLLEAPLDERAKISQDSYKNGSAALWGPVNFEDAVVRTSTNGKERRCSVSTKACPSKRWGRLENIHIVINKYHEVRKNSKNQRYVAHPQTIRIEADMGNGYWMPLIEDIVSTGKGKGYDTPQGAFPLSKNNFGRLKSTRNHCSSVADYGKDQGGFVELAPMPYAVHFNGGIALHAGNTTGKPESHGCVRQRKEIARETYCMLLEEDNWKRTTVYVQ